MVFGVIVGLMKKLRKGIKSPRLCSDFSERRVRQKPVQMDFFEGEFFYHERRLLYVQETQDGTK